MEQLELGVLKSGTRHILALQRVCKLPYRLQQIRAGGVRAVRAVFIDAVTIRYRVNSLEVTVRPCVVTMLECEVPSLLVKHRSCYPVFIGQSSGYLNRSLVNHPTFCIIVHESVLRKDSDHASAIQCNENLARQ